MLRLPGTPSGAGFRRARRVATIVFANVAIFCGVLVVIEVAARGYAVLFEGKTFFRAPAESPWFITYDAPRPQMTAEGGRFYHNDRVVSPRKAPGEYRIIALGGSTTVGRDAFDRAGFDYPLLLEQRLNASPSDRRFTVLNAGGDGFSTLHSLINLETRLLEFQPDLIIVMEGINDYTVNYFGDGATPDYANKYLKPYFVHPQFQVTSSAFGLLSQSRVLFAQRIPHRLTRAFGEIHRQNDSEAGSRYFVRHLRSIKAIAREFGVELLLVSQPNMLRASEKENQDARLYASLVRSFGTEHGVPMLDLFETFGRDSSLFVDDVHHTPDGVRRFVDLILPAVQRIATGSSRTLTSTSGDLAGAHSTP